MANVVNLITIPQQKTFSGKPFPIAYGPNTSLPGSTLTNFTAWLRVNREAVEADLVSYGAILFRDLGVETAADFNSIVESLGWPEFPYIGGAAPRTNVVGRVFTANESPPDQIIPFHHEMAQVPDNPARLLFYADVAPAAQGETPLLLNHILVQEIQKIRPDFVNKLREKGLIYIRILPEEDDPSSAIGRGWKSTYLTEEKAVAEKRAADLGVSLEWLDDGTVKTVTSVLPALRVEPRTGQEVWFNSMVAAYTGWKDSRNVPERAVLFGDGTPLPHEAIADVKRIMDEIAVSIPWQKGDVIILDNKIVQHSRNTFTPPRRVLASLTK